MSNGRRGFHLPAGSFGRQKILTIIKTGGGDARFPPMEHFMGKDLNNKIRDYDDT